MLVLSREIDEIIYIGDTAIQVRVVDIRGDKVRLGITAPKELAVHRKEVFEAIQRENRDATPVRPGDCQHVGKTAAPVLNNPKFHFAGSVAGENQNGRRR